MVLRDTCAQQGVEPIRVGGVAIIDADVVAQLFVDVAPLLCVQHVWLVGHVIHGDIAIIVDLGVVT